MKRKGFTLIETFIAVTVMLVGVIGVFGLLHQRVYFLPISNERLIATYLAQEGIEIVRNIRETNKIKDQDWKTGLTGCDSATGCQADYNDYSSLSPFQSRFLYVNNGFYQQDQVGTSTIYKRKIRVNFPAADPANSIMEVIVETFWTEKNRSHSVVVQENMYDW